MKQQPPVALLLERPGMSPLQKLLEIRRRGVLRTAGAGVQENESESERKKKMQGKKDGFGRGTEAVQQFISGQCLPVWGERTCRCRAMRAGRLGCFPPTEACRDIAPAR